MNDSPTVQKLVATGKWSFESARLGERAGFRCEYCDLNFLANIDNYKLWQIDHIVPVSSAGSEIEFDNLAVSCKQCNVDFKSCWDPRLTAGPTAGRAELIQAIRQYVRERRVELTRLILDPVCDIVGK